jgi:hypothetical protein
MPLDGLISSGVSTPSIIPLLAVAMALMIVVMFATSIRLYSSHGL